MKKDNLFDSVDWQGISEKDINQIKYEVENWQTDYKYYQKLKKLLGENVGESFEDKFNRWITDRIKMVTKSE